MDYLPAPQALSMIVRSRARDRASTCSKYALSRLDKMVTGLATAEDAFHHVRRPCKAIEPCLSSAVEGCTVRDSPLQCGRHLYSAAEAFAMRYKPLQRGTFFYSSAVEASTVR